MCYTGLSLPLQGKKKTLLHPSSFLCLENRRPQHSKALLVPEDSQRFIKTLHQQARAELIAVVQQYAELSPS